VCQHDLDQGMIAASLLNTQRQKTAFLIPVRMWRGQTNCSTSKNYQRQPCMQCLLGLHPAMIHLLVWYAIHLLLEMAFTFTRSGLAL